VSLRCWALLYPAFNLKGRKRERTSFFLVESNAINKCIFFFFQLQFIGTVPQEIGFYA